MSNNNFTCCKKCTERHVGCHIDCEAYLEQRKEFEKYKKEVAEYKQSFRGAAIKKGSFLGDSGFSKHKRR